MRTIITKRIEKKCKRKYCKSAYHRKFFNLAEKKKWRKKNICNIEGISFVGGWLCLTDNGLFQQRVYRPKN